MSKQPTKRLHAGAALRSPRRIGRLTKQRDEREQAADEAAPRRSGPTQSEKDRAANGMRQLKLRVDGVVIAQLDDLVEAAGDEWNRSSLVAALIARASKGRAR